MTDLNELFKVIAEGKKHYEETDPVGKKIKEAKEHVKEDLSGLFAQLVSLKEDLEKELVEEETKLVSLIDEDKLKQDAKNIVNEVFGQIKKPIITEEIPYQPVIHTPEVRAAQVDADVDKYLTDKSFQQPNPDVVSKNIDDIRNKIKFLEQAIGRVAAHGPGGGEVNLRWLDDVDRSTINDGWYLRYSESKKKFEFAEVQASGGNGATGATGIQGAQGATGLTGATGAGLNGASGVQGASGSTGPQGQTGATGIAGASGSQGQDGASGADSTVPGATGETGASGVNGLDGATGLQGDFGATGIDGASGATGLQGASGINGATGTNGASGVNGSTGPTGASGIGGATGATGNQGASGSTGPSGASGASGVADRYLTTSNTTHTITNNGDLTFYTNDLGLAYSAQQTINIVDGNSNYMTAYVVSYDKITGELVVHITGKSGSGTYSFWTINLSGAVGNQGASGPDGATGVQGASGVGATGLTGATGPQGSPGSGGAIANYGSFYDTTDQIAAVIDTAYPIPLGYTVEAVGTQIVDGTKVKVDYQGVYNIQFSLQLHNRGGAGSGTVVQIWLNKNGSLVPDSATKVDIDTNSPWGVAAWNFLLTLQANDYVELMWSTNNTVIVIEHNTATAPAPAIPSTILTIQQVMYTQVGATGYTGATGTQGIQGASGLQGASGVGATGITGASGINGASGTIGVNGASGATGIQGASGSTGAQGIQGASGSTGLTGATGNSVSASYLKYTRSTAQSTGLTAGSRIICNVSENTAGSDITIDTSTGQITLAANRTYRLRGAVPGWTSGGARPSFCWYNEATSAYIGEASQSYSSSDAAAYAATGGMAEAIITTASSTVVSFRILAVASSLTQLGGNGDFSTTGSYPWVDVEVISGNSPLLNGATGATGIQGASGATGPAGATGPTPSFGSVNWAQTYGASGFSGATGATGTVFSAAAFTGAGSPIEVTACGDANPLANGAWCRLQLYRDSIAIGLPIQVESSSSNENVPYAFHVIDNPGAGTFTYSLRVTASAGGGFQFGEAATGTFTIKELSNVRGATGAQGIQGASGVSIPAWTSGGAITIGGTTTAPTKGGTLTKDNISYRQVGAKEWEVSLTYYQTSNTGANNGSGDYLFTLPNSLSFDTTVPTQVQYQSNINTSTWFLATYVIPGANGMITQSTTGGRLFPIIYNATQFRILTINDTAWVRCMGSGHFQLGDNSYVTIQMTFRFTST